MKRTLLAGLIGLLLTSPVFAAGDAERGKGLTATCAACHGQDGKSMAGTFPNIAGQGERYLLKQMTDIKAGTRAAPLMTGMLDAMSEQDLEDLAAWYASQEGAHGAADPDLVELGESIYRAGVGRKSIPACTACHSPTGRGNDVAKWPMLRGQWPEYTIAQLKAFRSGQRANDGDGRMMRNVAMDLSDSEIEALASYLYGLH